MAQPPSQEEWDHAITLLTEVRDLLTQQIPLVEAVKENTYHVWYNACLEHRDYFKLGGTALTVTDTEHPPIIPDWE